MAGYHDLECGMRDMYGTILNNVTAISQGRTSFGDTNDYSRLALRVSARCLLRSFIINSPTGHHSPLAVLAQQTTTNKETLQCELLRPHIFPRNLELGIARAQSLRQSALVVPDQRRL